MRGTNRKPRVRVIIIHVTVFFWDFLFFISSQHSEGVVYTMTMREKVNEGDEGFLEKVPLGSDM
jgi:hypothetical protein